MDAGDQDGPSLADFIKDFPPSYFDCTYQEWQRKLDSLQGAMDTAVLRNFYVTFVRRLDWQHCCDRLYRDGVLSDEAVQEVSSRNTRQDRIRKMLGLLPGCERARHSLARAIYQQIHGERTRSTRPFSVSSSGLSHHGGSFSGSSDTGVALSDTWSLLNTSRVSLNTMEGDQGQNINLNIFIHSDQRNPPVQKYLTEQKNPAATFTGEADIAGAAEALWTRKMTGQRRKEPQRLTLNSSTPELSGGETKKQSNPVLRAWNSLTNLFSSTKQKQKKCKSENDIALTGMTVYFETPI